MEPIKIKLLSPNAQTPEYKTKGAAGADIYAANDIPIYIEPKAYAVIPTGIAIEIPEGYEGQMRARSGLAFNEQLGIPLGLGTIDSDYRGEIKMLLYNFGNTVRTIVPKERIAQLVINKVEQCDFMITETLSQTNRGEKGFGSTGLR